MVLTLMSYKAAEFDQGKLLSARYPLKKDAQVGVCYALVIEFFRTRLKDSSKTAAQMVTHLDQTLGTAINRQAMFEDGLKEFKRRGGGVYDLVQLFNAMGRVSGMSWTFGNEAGTTAAQFAVGYDNSLNGEHVIFLEFLGGVGHAIGFVKSPDRVELFDPNFGIFVSANAGALAAGLWAQYGSLNMTISEWKIIEMVSGGGGPARGALRPA